MRPFPASHPGTTGARGLPEGRAPAGGARYPYAMHRALVVVALALVPACRNRTPAPERSAPPTRLNVSATGFTPEVHINPQDGGALDMQVGGARVQLPDENAQARQAEREAQ